jgi:hypothetical protein
MERLKMNSVNVSTFQFVCFFLLGMFLAIGGIYWHDILFYVILSVVIAVKLLESVREK